MGLTSSSSRSKPCLDLDFSGHSIKQITNPHLFLEVGINSCLSAALKGEDGFSLREERREQRKENSCKGKKEKDNFFFFGQCPELVGDVRISEYTGLREKDKAFIKTQERKRMKISVISV